MSVGQGHLLALTLFSACRAAVGFFFLFLAVAAAAVVVVAAAAVGVFTGLSLCMRPTMLVMWS